MQSTISTLLLAALTGITTTITAVSAAPTRSTTGEPNGTYIGQVRAWNTDSCGADFNMGYVKLYSSQGGLCQRFEDYYPEDSAQTAAWEHRPEGWVMELYTDAECAGEVPALVNDDCVFVGDRYPDVKAWKGFKILGPEGAK